MVPLVETSAAAAAAAPECPGLAERVDSWAEVAVADTTKAVAARLRAAQVVTAAVAAEQRRDLDRLQRSAPAATLSASSTIEGAP